MVSVTQLSAFLIIAAVSIVAAFPSPSTPHVPSDLVRRQVDCTGVAPSLGGQPCGGTNIMTCLTTTSWQCPDGSTGVVPPGTECICNAFRHPGWEPNNALPNQNGTPCTSGIVCVVEGGTQFRVCGVSGLQPPQDVPPGTVCRNGGITWP